jgi:hypothetical protein
MRMLLAVPRELWRLFVDDGSLALALVIWCAAVGAVLPWILPYREWDAAALFLGCISILFIDVAVTVLRTRVR